MMAKTPIETFREQFQIEKGISDWPTNLSVRVFPHQDFPVVALTDGERQLHRMSYSLIPHWSKVRKPKFATYNARIETIEQKPTWRDPLAKRRCLVGLTSFYESCYEGSHAGNIVQFKSKKDRLLVAAGLYDEWIDKESGEVVESFAIITREPTKYIREVGHDRCPYFIDEGAWEEWLNPEPAKAQDMKEMLLESFSEPDLDVEIERPMKPGWEKR